MLDKVGIPQLECVPGSVPISIDWNELHSEVEEASRIVVEKKIDEVAKESEASPDTKKNHMVALLRRGMAWRRRQPRHLVTHTADGPIAVIMLVVFFTITFGAVQIGYQIMMLGDDHDDDDDDHGGLRQPIPIRLNDNDRR